MIASYLCFLLLNNNKSTIIQVRGHEVIHADESTRIFQTQDKQRCNNNALSKEIPQTTLYGYSSAVMIYSQNRQFTDVVWPPSQ